MKEEYINSGRKNQKLKTKRRILDSAQQFIVNGRHFTLEDIAADSGISRATIYRYYTNTEGLYQEAGLDMNTKSPETICKELEGMNVSDKLFAIQNYFNSLAQDHEMGFRKYLSAVIGTSTSGEVRGARRNKTLEYALTSDELNLNQEELSKLINVSVVLMGIEPLITTKDVCRLNNEESKELLNWGLGMILKGIGLLPK